MTTAHSRINTDYRHGDDTRAARWLRRYRRLSFTADTLRYFRKQPNAYTPELRALFVRAYRKIQNARKDKPHGKDNTNNHANLLDASPRRR